MRLYHFTRPSRYPLIQREGLRANADTLHDEERFLTRGIPCVWFYNVSERPTISEEYSVKYNDGHPEHLPTAFLRLDVNIPKKDPRLHPWMLWATTQFKPLDGMPAEFLKMMALCWVFFGDVKPKNIRVGLLEIPHEGNTSLRKIFDAECSVTPA